MIINETQFLAYELAKEFNDKKHFGFYAKLLKKFSPAFVLKIFRDLKETKNWSKVQNKGAYFTASFFNFIKQLDKTKKKD